MHFSFTSSLIFLPQTKYCVFSMVSLQMSWETRCTGQLIQNVPQWIGLSFLVGYEGGWRRKRQRMRQFCPSPHNMGWWVWLSCCITCGKLESTALNSKCGQWHPTPVLLPGKYHGWRSLEGCSPWGRESRTRLSDFTFTFHFYALEKEMATHSSVLAWRIPGMGEPGGLPSLGSHRVGHDWSDLAAAWFHIK